MIHVHITKEIKRFKGTEKFLVQTDFSVGAVTHISGPSGAGKTTLLRIIAGLVKPEHGHITFEGETWLNTTENLYLPTQARKVGFVFQDYALFPNMTVKEHLSFGTKDVELIQRLLILGKMERFIDQRPRELSGGQQQRLSILRALTTRPRLLLMDEPFSALDQALKAELVPDLKLLLIEMKTTCLVSTHYPLELKGFADFYFEL
ncbi:ATP-binding cassette domain-containing protein [Pedobacter duraquae]|uniref:ABC transporter family protein n=1 Tax=Pedobacter duraquae TaxID=425511 RepID=A0A4V3C423_9SPHI|nr:ATP-binding cassette domain-containing protein [Pedobacter duraquae]TDO24308.1 ABC transporter family protein [Pedobacter duraquae]